MARDYLARHFDRLQVAAEFDRLRAAAQRLVRTPFSQQRIRLLTAALLQHGTLSWDAVSSIAASQRHNGVGNLLLGFP
jgi:hypothetical protein